MGGEHGYRRPIRAHLGPGADDEAGEGGLQLGADVLGEEGEHGGAAEHLRPGQQDQLGGAVSWVPGGQGGAQLVPDGGVQYSTAHRTMQYST